MDKKTRTDKNLVIAFDAESMVAARRSGVGYYTKGLIESLANNYKNVELVGHYFNFLGRRTITELPHAKNIQYVVTKICPAKIPNMLRRLGVWIPFELFTRRRADFHIFPAFIGWPSLFKTSSAPMIHDTAFLDHPQLVNRLAQFDLERLVPKEIERAAFIITNSNFSAERLRKKFKTNNKPIVVGHIPPVDAVPVAPARAKKLLGAMGIKNKYVLFLGNLEPRKNLPRLIKAFSSLDAALRNRHALVLAGGKGWLDEDIIKSIDEARSKGINIVTPGYVDEEQRAALYSSATALAIVSTYEGFGMTLLEAMRYKTPILASDIPAHREAAGNAALFCNPQNTEDISLKLSQLLKNPAQRKKLIAAGEKQLKLFSWQSVARAVITEIRKVKKP